MSHLTELTAGNKRKHDLRWRQSTAPRKRSWVCVLAVSEHPVVLVTPDTMLQRQTVCPASQLRKDSRTDLLGGPRSWESTFLSKCFIMVL